MHIANITIKNFRAFEEFELTLNKGLNLIVGENNSGKTTLIDAIRLALDTTSSEWTRVKDSDFNLTKNCNDFSIQIKFDEIQPQHAHVFVEHLNQEKVDEHKNKSVLYVNFIAQRTNVKKRGTYLIRTELRSGKNAEGPLIDSEIREYLSATYLKPLRDAEAELSASRFSRLSQIISSSNDFKRGSDTFDALLKIFITASQEIKKNAGIKKSNDKISKNFTELIFKDDEKIFNVMIDMIGSKDLESMNPSEKERAFQDILQKLSLSLSQSQPNQGLGYSNLLYMATELLLLKTESDSFPLLLIEEPEAHLHPQLQMKFLQYIRDLSPSIQSILTTHSPNLASKAPLESIIFMKDYVAYSMRKGETKLSSDDYVFLEKFLDVTKSNLFFAKAVLIVEGDAENILLPTIAKLLGQNLEDYGVSVVNVGSTANARFAKVFIRSDNTKPMNIRVACIRDLDLWPIEADKEQFPDCGFKEFKPKSPEGKGGNEDYWLPRNHPISNLQIGTNEQDKIKKLQNLDNETKLDEMPNASNVKVFVSDKWTFEYSLIKKGLEKEIYRVCKGYSFDDDNKFSNDWRIFENEFPDKTQRAVKIFSLVDKTETAYKLSIALEKKYLNNPEEFKKLLPSYLVNAIEHVTAPLSIEGSK